MNKETFVTSGDYHRGLKAGASLVWEERVTVHRALAYEGALNWAILGSIF